MEVATYEKNILSKAIKLLLTLAFVLTFVLMTGNVAKAEAAPTTGDWKFSIDDSGFIYEKGSQENNRIVKVVLTQTTGGYQVTAYSDDISDICKELQYFEAEWKWVLSVNGTETTETVKLDPESKTISRTFSKVVSEGDEIKIGLGWQGYGFNVDAQLSDYAIYPPITAKYGIDYVTEDYYQNDVQFGKTYVGGATERGQYYYFVMPAVTTDSIIRIEAVGTSNVKAGFARVGLESVTLPYKTLLCTDSEKYKVAVAADGNWSIRICREDVDYGSVSLSWDPATLTSGKVLANKDSNFTITLTPGKNFGTVNDDAAIFGVTESAGYSTSTRKTKTEKTGTYRGSSAGQCYLSVTYGIGEAYSTITKKLYFNVCPAKPETPANISGSKSSIKVSRYSGTTNWMLQIYKGGKWQNVSTSKYGTTGGSMTASGLKANTTYSFRVYDVKPPSGSVPALQSPNSTTFKAKTAPATKPVLKSVKISKVKSTYHPAHRGDPYLVGDHWNPGNLVPAHYTTSFTVTLKLKKTISGSKARYVSIKMASGKYLTKVVTGNKTSYSYKVTLNGKYSAAKLRGKYTTVKATSDSKGKIQGPASGKVKTK